MTERTILRQTRAAVIDDSISFTSSQSDQYSSDQEFLVERILAERKQQDGKIYYLVFWSGFPEEKSTWEPRKNIQDPAILTEWKARKDREARGTEPTFNLAEFNERIQEIARAKAERHESRKLKRKSLGIPSPSDLETNHRAVDSESTDAMEVDEEPEDDPSMKVKSNFLQKARNSTAVTSVQRDPAKAGPRRRRVKGRKKDDDRSDEAGLSDDSLIEDLQKKAKRKALRNKGRGQGGSPVSAGSDKRPNSPLEKPSRMKSPSESPHEVPVPEQRRGQERSSEPTDTPISKQHGNQSETPAKPLSMAISRGFFAGPATQGPPAGRAPSALGSRRGATRGGSSLAHKNVFATRKPARKRPTLIENAADSTKDQKHFTNWHLRRKAQLAGREIADAAPDLAALGGLFSPSNPSSFQPLRPATLRRSSMAVPLQPDSELQWPHVENDDSSGIPSLRRHSFAVDDSGMTHDFANTAPQFNSSILPASSTKSVWQERDPYNAICYYWHNRGSCTKGDNCRYLHSDAGNLPVAPAPKPHTEFPVQTCRFWAAGNCFKSAEECPYFHGFHESSNAIYDNTESIKQKKSSSTPISIKDGANATSIVRRKSVSFGAHDIFPSSNEPETHLSNNQLSDEIDERKAAIIVRSKLSKGVCFHWARSDCYHGEKCWFRHEYVAGEKPMEIVFDPKTSKPHFRQPTGSSESTTDNNTVFNKVETSTLIRKTNSSLSQPVNSTINQQQAPDPIHPAMSPLNSTFEGAPEVSSSEMQRKKISVDDYRRRKSFQALGNGVKKISFDKDDSHFVMADFGDLDQSIQQPWGPLFLSLKALQFNQMCMAQDFQAQYGYILSQILWQGTLTPDSTDKEALTTMDTVWEQLRQSSAGLMSLCTDFNILIYPAIKEWEFIEGRANLSSDVRWRYLVFKTDLDVNEPLQTIHTGTPTSYRQTLTRSVHGLNFKTFVPTLRRDQKYHFYLLFPSTATQTADLIASWLRATSDQIKIYSSQTEGSWDFFVKDPSIEVGIVLIHESAISYISQLPSLLKLITPPSTAKSFTFWYITDSRPKYPLFPIPESSSLGQIISIRLLPHGCAFLLTPSFLVAQPEKAHDIILWFKQKKLPISTPGTWKLVCCHNFRQYLLDLALEKSFEKDELEAKHYGEDRKEAIADERGLSYPARRDRFRCHELISELLSRKTTDGYSDYDSDRPDELVSPIIYADESIDPDDEKALATWFAGWSITKLDQFRKFAILGTGLESSKRATRRKEVTISEKPGAKEPRRGSLPVEMFSASKKPVRAGDRRTSIAESSVQVKKRRALEIAAKLTAFAPTTLQSIAGAQERNPSDIRKLSSTAGSSSGSESLFIPPARTQHLVEAVGTIGKQQGISKAITTWPDSDINMGINSSSGGERILISTKQTIEPQPANKSLQFQKIASNNIETAEENLTKSNEDAAPLTKRYLADPRVIQNHFGADDPMDIDYQLHNSATKEGPYPARLDNAPHLLSPPQCEIDGSHDNLQREAETDTMDISRVEGSQLTKTTSTSSASSGNDQGEIVVKQMKFEATTAWYGRLAAEGKGWEHIYVEGWEKVFRFVGVK